MFKNVKNIVQYEVIQIWKLCFKIPLYDTFFSLLIDKTICYYDLRQNPDVGTRIRCSRLSKEWIRILRYCAI